jgi:hypothetical protein
MEVCRQFVLSSNSGYSKKGELLPQCQCVQAGLAKCAGCQSNGLCSLDLAADTKGNFHEHKEPVSRSVEIGFIGHAYSDAIVASPSSFRRSGPDGIW